MARRPNVAFFTAMDTLELAMLVRHAFCVGVQTREGTKEVPMKNRWMVILVAAFASSPAVARADEETDDLPDRTFGASVGLSGGYFSVVGTSGAGGGAALSPLDVELEMPLSRTLSLQVWVPVGTLIVSNLDEDSTFLWTNFFLKWSPRGGEGAYLSPGVGFMFSTIDGAGAVGPEVSARIGYEFSSDEKGFGFTMGVRPWVDVLFGTEGGAGAGFGTAAEMGFHFYGH
jgi:hypothetical protein